MWFWWFMYACDLIIPIVMMIAGRLMWKNCPKKINPIYGYRTALSMKNMDTWRFAHEYCGRIWWIWGIAMLVVSAIIPIPLFHSGENAVALVGTVVLGAQLVALILSALRTESALRKTFFDDGSRR